MEHGVLGESRAKAFLTERFWVLERSVDVQGADYLIQRRLTDLNFMDSSPPKLGVVQVKFVQDDNTYIYINKDYICDDASVPYGEFFLLVFTGRENLSRSFLLSSQNVIDLFKEESKKDKQIFKTRAAAILNSKNYEILDQSATLDRIDHALRSAEFRSNRMFLRATTYMEICPDQIEHDLLLPLDNQYADIGKAFFDERKRLQRTLFDMEEVVEAMQNMLRVTDPEVAYEIYEDVIRPRVSSTCGLSFGSDFFNDEDFLSAIQNHKARLRAIRDLGLESSFFALLRFIETETIDQVAALAPSKSQRLLVTLTYDLRTLQSAVIRVDSTDSEEKCPRVLESQLGRHVIEFLPQSWLPAELQKAENGAISAMAELKSHYLERSWLVRRPFQREIEKILVGEELAEGW